MIIAADEAVGHGLAGIIAGHLARQYNHPAVVLSAEGEIWRGSGRAPAGYNLVEILALAQAREYLYTFGGHPQTVGLSIWPDRLGQLRETLNRLLPPPQLPAFQVDALLSARDISNIQEVAALRLLELYGHGNPQPLFLLRGAHPLYAARTSTGEHVRFKLGTHSLSGSAAGTLLVFYNGVIVSREN